MSDSIQGIPYLTAEFDKDGGLLAFGGLPAGISDLIVVSHGWNNNRAEAESLYRKLFANFAQVTRDDALIGARKLAILGVIWPSKRFDELMSEPAATGGSRDGARSAGAADKAAEAVMMAAIDRIAPLFDGAGDQARLARLKALVPGLEDGEAAREQFVETLRDLLDPDGSSEALVSEDDGSEFFIGSSSPGDIFEAAEGRPARDTGPTGDDGAAAGLGSFFSKAANKVTNLLNLTSYYEMKKRAGTVGAKGVAPLLDKLAPSVERIHLVGHSFGGRVVTAAAAASSNRKLRSLALLQAAFSHFGFAKKNPAGFFRSVVDGQRIRGPILITHTKNDTAVGKAYPTASRISRDRASAFGDANDEFGAIGSNGAQRMEAGEVSAVAKALLDIGKAYSFEAGRIHNLESSRFIVDPQGGDAHGWVFVPQVAWAISRAMVWEK